MVYLQIFLQLHKSYGNIHSWFILICWGKIKVPKKAKEFDFEKSLTELEKLVEVMEDGDLSLEDSLKQFERSIALTRACHQALSDAEQKVKILMKDQDNKDELVDFEPEDDQS